MTGPQRPSRSSSAGARWQPGLRGRPEPLCVVLLGWLGGGLLATAVATVTEGPNDLAYGLTNTAAACAGLLLLALAPRDVPRRRGVPVQPVPAEPVRVPAQAAQQHDRREPALH